MIADEQDGFWTNYFLIKNSKAGVILKSVKSFLKNDKVIKADLERLKKAERTKLCSK